MTASTTSPVDEVIDLLRQLRLPHMRHAAAELLATAKAQRWDPAEAVRALLTEELAGRQASSIGTRRRAAGFPTGKTFDGWDETVSSIPAPTQRALRTLEWIDRHENVVVCGPSGTGKSHFLEALGQPPSTAALMSPGSASKPSARSSAVTGPTTPPAGPSRRSCAPTSS